MTLTEFSLQLVELMRGDIWLESKLGQGTTATFWIPFNKAPYQDDGSPLIDLASIPDRLQSDVSVSCGSSEDHTPPLTPKLYNGNAKLSQGRGDLQQSQMPPAVNLAIPDHLINLSESERQKIHILVVEDKCVPKGYPFLLTTVLIRCMQSNQPTDCPEDNQKAAFQCECSLERTGSSRLPGKAAVCHASQAGYYPNGCPGRRPPEARIKRLLMIVQMPILDGYSATHAIRTEFNNAPEVRNVPIIAMTASAIQGDREKCQQAGMDVSSPSLSTILRRC